MVSTCEFFFLCFWFPNLYLGLYASLRRLAGFHAPPGGRLWLAFVEHEEASSSSSLSLSLYGEAVK